MIYINGRFLTQRMTGVQRYGFEITKRLLLQDDTIKIVVPSKYKNLLNDDLKKIFGERIIFWGKLSNLLWEQLVLPFFLIKTKGVLINLCNSAPIVYRNKITCIHDMSYKVSANWFSKKMRIYYNFLIPLLVRTSKKIITVSEFSKTQILFYFPTVKASKIFVIPNACSEIFKNKTCSNITKSEYQFVFVGSLEPRKNLNTLLEVFKQIEDERLKLIIVGVGNKKIFKRSNYVCNDKRVLFENDLNDEQLKKLYEASKALINPSFYEGFGIPLVEAANSSCLLIVSDIPSFYEVAGDNAIYFDPSKPETLKNAILSSLEMNSAKISNITSLALKMADRFNWSTSSRMLYDLIKN